MSDEKTRVKMLRDYANHLRRAHRDDARICAIVGQLDMIAWGPVPKEHNDGTADRQPDTHHEANA